MDEMQQLFDIRDVNKAASAFNPEKLLWLNQQHIMRATPERLAEYLKPQLAALGVAVTEDRTLVAVAKVMQERAKTLREMAQNSLYFFRDFTSYDEKAAKKNLTAEAVRPLTLVLEKLAALTDWRAAAIHDIVNLTASELQLGLGKVAQPIRVAVSGTAVSPPIDVVLEVLGRATTLARLQRALDYAARQ
jgi:glutamyl-tRNA synthetase